MNMRMLWLAVGCCAGLVNATGCLRAEGGVRLACCASCDDSSSLRTAEECRDGEIRATSCAPTSECALAYFVGTQAAQCCTGCETTDAYVEVSGRCEDGDVYLHQCDPQSVCYQTHRADAVGGEFVPWQLETSNSVAPLNAIWGLRKNDLWAAGAGGEVLHSDGSRWRGVAVPTESHLTGIFGLAADDFWIVGGDGTILRYDGAWRRIDLPFKNHFLGVWGVGDMLWVVGQGGIVLSYDGRLWREESVPATEDLFSVHGSDEGHVWAVGARGTIAFYDGSIWHDESLSEKAPVLLDVVVVDGTTDDVWAVGTGGTVIHRQAQNWVRETIPFRGDLTAATYVPSGLWVVGERGSVFRFRDRTWTPITYFLPRQSPTWLDVASVQDSLWASGSGGLIIHAEVELAE